MPRAVDDLTFDEKNAIVRKRLKGTAAATLETEYDLNAGVVASLITTFGTRQHPNDTGGSGLTTETLVPGPLDPITGEARP